MGYLFFRSWDLEGRMGFQLSASSSSSLQVSVVSCMLSDVSCRFSVSSMYFDELNTSVSYQLSVLSYWLLVISECSLPLDCPEA